MAAPDADQNYDRFRNIAMYARNSNSSDSEENDASTSYRRSPKNETHHHHHHQAPKRNKRKNFEPRCSNMVYSDTEGEHSAFSELHVDNNNLKNFSRRKTASTRRLLTAETRLSPIDLSKTNESESVSDESENDTENYEENSSETDSKVSSSFSIRNLAKPHVPDYGVAAGVGVSSPAQLGLSHGQVHEMREYAMSTMRELLGIYGLTSEVAESISRQLPIAAFNSGEQTSAFVKLARNAVRTVL